MKRFLVLFFSLIILSLTAFVLAQASSGGAGSEDFYDSPLSSFTSFEAYFFRAFRVVDAPCPTEVFGDTCYFHGYNDFFDFRDRFYMIFQDLTATPEGLTEVERWAFTTAEVEGEEAEVFRASYRLPEGELFTLIFSPAYIFLER